MTTHWIPSFAAALALALASSLSGCAETPTEATGALAKPVDLAFACEGDGATVAPLIDERRASLNDASLCPTFEFQPTGAPGSTLVQGDFFGAALNQDPPGVLLWQLNPAGGTRSLGPIDSDAFIPGYTPLETAEYPIRVLTAPDYSAFYVVSAGERRVQRLEVEGYADALSAEVLDGWDLPSVPADAVMVGDLLIVVAAWLPELWVYDLASDPLQPALTTVPLAGLVRELVPTFADDPDRLGYLVTWTERPVLTRLDATFATVAEVPLVPQCADTLDNDGDGVADAGDADCFGEDDDLESGSAGPRSAEPAPEPPAFYAEGAAPCEDGIDNDGDGLTDWPREPSCASAGDDGELKPMCNDGIDNDGDGKVDVEDGSCYGPDDQSEAQENNFGPFLPALVAPDVATLNDARCAAEPSDDPTQQVLCTAFVYVLDQSRDRFIVYELDPNSPTMTRVDVWLEAATVDELPYMTYSGGTADPLPGMRKASRPAVSKNGLKDLPLPGASVSSVVGMRTRGELWDHIPNEILRDGGTAVQPEYDFGRSGTSWPPAGCLEGSTDTCVEPPADNQNYFVFAGRLDGRIQAIEAVRRGVPLHRYLQSDAADAVSERDVTIDDAPTLSIRGRGLSVSSKQVREGYPFMGPLLREEIEDRITEAQAKEDGVEPRPRKQRLFGLWPVDDPEEVVDEVWWVQYEGPIPDAGDNLGRFVDATTFKSPGRRFCESGVAAGDRLFLFAPRPSVPESLFTEVDLVTEDGVVCPVKAPREALFDVQIVEVGQDELVIDPSTARLWPNEPDLDEDAAREGNVSISACTTALRELRDELWFPENIVAVPGQVTPENLPARLRYSVRAGETWILVGSRSGFAHRQVWDAQAGACVIDETLDARLDGRLEQATLNPGQAYDTCPPSDALIDLESVDTLITSERLTNFSFGIDMLPACRLAEDGSVEMVPTQRSTRWAFTIDGPDRSLSLLSPGVEHWAAPTLKTYTPLRGLVDIDPTNGFALSTNYLPSRRRLTALSGTLIK